MENKRKNVLTGMGILFSLILIFEFILIPSASSKYNVESLKKSIIMETEGRFVTDFVKNDIDDVNVLSKKIGQEYDIITAEKQNYINKAAQNRKKISDLLSLIEKRDFNYTMFDQELNNLISENSLELKLGIPRKGNDDIREYPFTDQSGRIKKARVYFQTVEYRVTNTDFQVFGKFLDIVEKKYKFLLFEGFEIEKNRYEDGNVDFVIKFLVPEKVTGKTRNEEVELLK